MTRTYILLAGALLGAGAGWGQDAMPGMHMDEPAAPSPAPAQTQTLTRDTEHLQEPENPFFHVGTDIPAPELLNEVAKRPPMDLQIFLDSAEKGNPTLAQARAYVARSEGQARQAGLYPNPQGSYQGEQIRGGAYGGGEQGGFLQQQVVLGGKLGLRRGIYAQQAASDRIEVAAQQFRVRDDVEQAFYSALTAQALAVLRQRLLGVAVDALRTAHELENVGQADAPDVLQAEVEAEQAKIEFVTAQRAFLQDFRVLAALANQPALPPSPLRGELETPPALDVEKQVADVLANSPTLKRAEQEVRVAEARLKDAKREAVPDLLLRAGEQYSGETLVETPRRTVSAQSFASVGVNLPLWNRNGGNIGAAEAELGRARAEVDRTRLALQAQAAPLAEDYQAARFSAERYRGELIPRARRAYELYLLKYQQAAEAYPQVLVSQRTLFQTQIGYLEALGGEWSAAAALQNYGLRGGLEMPSASGSNATDLNLPIGGGGE